MKVVCAYLMLSALCHGTALCSRELFLSNSSVTSVINQLRWRAFWLNDTSLVPVVDKPQFSLLLNERYVGYCAKAWRVCMLYEVQKNEAAILKVDAAPFDESIAAGTWTLTANRTLLSGAKNSQHIGNHELGTGGKRIRDPLVKSAKKKEESRVETIGLRSCIIDSGAVALEVPDSVRLRRRPSRAASLIRAIKQQGLSSFAKEVVVPYFDDQDPGVLIALERPAGGCEVLMVHNLSVDSWAFHPVSEIRTESGVREACRKIESSAMVKLPEGKADQWIK